MHKALKQFPTHPVLLTTHTTALHFMAGVEGVLFRKSSHSNYIKAKKFYAALGALDDLAEIIPETFCFPFCFVYFRANFCIFGIFVFLGVTEVNRIGIRIIT